ncbi:MAG TPA: DUF58 domain-containing protein [Cellulomonas sp.]
MTTASDQLLLRLEWRVLRRLDGRLQGAYRTAQRGAGLDLAGLRAYSEGDDARHIDWNVTARMDEPYLREFTEDREITAWLVLDRSASMAAGADGRGKDGTLTELALVLARLLGRGGNRVGAVLYDTGAVRVVPPRTGRRQALVIATELERTAPRPAGPAPRRAARRRRGRGTGTTGSTTDLAAMLTSVAALAQRRSLVLVLSDLIGVGDWARPLLRLAQRHDVVALRIADPVDDALPEVGLVVVQDAETGEQLVVDSGDPEFRAGLRAAAAAREAAIADGMRRAAVPVHRVGTDRDLAETLVEIVGRTGGRGR